MRLLEEGGQGEALNPELIFPFAAYGFISISQREAAPGSSCEKNKQELNLIWISHQSLSEGHTF